MTLVRTLQRSMGVTDSGTVSNANSRSSLVYAVMSNTLGVTLNAAILIFGLLGSDPQDDVRQDIPGICLVFRAGAHSTTTYTTNNVCICVGN